MKKIVYILVFGLLLVTSSCNDWLTVEPKTLSTKDKMFSTEMGFETALTGLYLNLRDLYTPGKFMMGAEVDIMADLYPSFANNYGVETPQYLLYTHNYTGTILDTSLNTVFEGYYKVIANANVLLEALDEQNFLTDDMASLLKGEALAIRAFCHAELLRLWGPSPKNVNASRTYLPYVTQYSTDKYPYDTYQDYVTKMFADFTNAEQLLEKVDPLTKYSNSQLNTTYISNLSGIDDVFWVYRQKRFNVYGVKALMARMYLWTGDKENAYKLAKEVVDAKNVDGTSKFTLGTVNDISAINGYDYLFSKEHLVGIDIENFTDNLFSTRFGSYSTTSDQISKLYGGESDVRLKLFTTNTLTPGVYSYGTLKFTQFQDYSTGLKSVPIIRLAEMYLILMETAPLDEANTYYKTFCTARSASYTAMTENDRNSEILKEYIKEFFSEGQVFFVHKRMGLSSMFMSGMPMTMDQYQLPIPSEETQY